jgi:hypothetical protein
MAAYVWRCKFERFPFRSLRECLDEDSGSCTCCFRRWSSSAEYSSGRESFSEDWKERTRDASELTGKRKYPREAQPVRIWTNPRECAFSESWLSSDSAFDLIAMDAQGRLSTYHWHRRRLLHELSTNSSSTRRASFTEADSRSSPVPHSQSDCESRAAILQSRDLRLLNPIYRDQPVFLMRSDLILAALDRHVLAIMQPGRLFLQQLACPESKSLNDRLIQWIRVRLSEHGNAFEVVALEALLVLAHETLARRANVVKLALEERLAPFASHPNKRLLEEIRVLKRELASVATEAQNYSAALERVLGDDLPWHIAEMTLVVASSGDMLTTSSDLESLLESSMQKFRGWSRLANELCHRVGNAEQIIELSLAVTQMRLWSFNALLHLVTVSAFLIMIPPDYFGMSIWIPVYDRVDIYWPWLLTTFLLMLLSFGFLGTGIWILRRKKLLFPLFKSRVDH